MLDMEHFQCHKKREVFADVMKKDDTNYNAYNYIWEVPDPNISGDDYPA